MTDPIFTENSRRIFDLRYPRKDAEGLPTESPAEVIQRVATNVASVGALYHDTTKAKRAPRKDHADYGEFPYRTARRQYEWLKKKGRTRGTFDAVMHAGEGAIDEQARRYADMISDWKFLPNSPTWTGAGTPLGQLAACFVLPIIDDLGRARNSIFGTLNVAALIQQTGGGNGFSFGNLRPKNSIIKTSMGRATGPVGFMKTYDAAFGNIGQGGSRSGANMGVLPVSHPDVREFMLCKTIEGEIANFNISIALTDEFMQAVEDDTTFDLTFEGQVFETVQARDLFHEIAENAWVIGDPGNLFIDRAHDTNPCPTRYTIEATNPCFHPDTMIETVHGPVRIADITEPTEVLTKGPSGTIEVRKASAAFITKRDAETLTINLSNGRSLTVTPEHRIMLVDGTYVEAQMLRPGDRVEALCQARRGYAYAGVKLASEPNRAYRMKHQVIYEGVHGPIPEGYDINHIDRDTFNNDIDNFELLDHSMHARLTRSQVSNDHQVQGADGRFVTHASSRQGVKRVRHLPPALSSAWRNQPRVITITHGPITDVYDIMVDETHNVIADFVVAHNCGEQYLGPYENCCLGSISLNKFVTKWFTLTDDGYVHEYGTFDWDEYARVIRLATEFLDDVVDANQYVPAVPELESAAQGGRRIGLGLMGAADAMAMMGVRYGSTEGEQLLSQFTEFARYHSMAASIERARLRGPFEWIEGSIYDPDGMLEYGPGGIMPNGVTLWEVPAAQFSSSLWGMPTLDWMTIISGIAEHGIRNCCQFTFAPTGTISNVAALEGSGLEPFFALIYKRWVTQFGERLQLDYFSPLLAYALEELLGYDAETCEKILHKVSENHGSIQGIDEIPVGVQWAFPVAADVTWQEHIRMQAAAQQWVDNSISKTINMPKSATVADVEEAYMMAWKSGCKGITIYRQGSRDIEVLSTGPATVENQVEEALQATIAQLEAKSHEWPHLRPMPQPASIKSEGLAARVYPVESFYGNVQVTITELDEYPGRPWDVRLQIGKGGNDTNAHVEALGRTISVALRTGVDVAALVDQLLDIGGHSSVGFGPQKVRSVGDGVAKLLRRLYMQGERVAPGWASTTIIPSVTEHVSITQYGNTPGFMTTVTNFAGNGTTLASPVLSAANMTTVAMVPVALPNDICPNCNLATLVMESGCRHCEPRLGGCGTFSGCD